MRHAHVALALLSCSGVALAQPPTDAFPDPGAAAPSASVAPSPSAVPPPASPAPAITTELLRLCFSSDPMARRYCLKQLELARDLPEPAHAVLQRMSGNDPELSSRAGALYRRAYGTEPPTYTGPPPAPPSAEEPPPEPAERGKQKLPPGDPTRVVFGPTAIE